ncbi:MAG: hypothetical protein ABSF80_10745 [Chitinispirillaceae bacterium]
MSTAQEIRDEIIDYIVASDSPFSDWYVGTAPDPLARLFTDHKVDKEGHWIYKDAGSEECARAIGEFVINTYKTKGLISAGAGDIAMWDESAQNVYAFAITEKTIQNPQSVTPSMDEQHASSQGIQEDK